MTYYTNYNTVLKNCYAIQISSEKSEPTLKETVTSMIYPAMGVSGIVYQIYLLLF